jgi:hypothetical protein
MIGKFFIENCEQFEPGDILLFTSGAKPDRLQQLITEIQKIIAIPDPLKLPYVETTHAGIFVGHKEEKGNKNPIIAHYTSTNPVIEEMPDKQRGIVVFRFKKPEIAKAIAEIAKKAPDDPSYNIVNFIKVILPDFSYLHDKQDNVQPIQRANICSEFVISCIKNSLFDLYKEGKISEQEFNDTRLKIHNISTPMSLATELSKNSEVNIGIYAAGNNPYEAIKQVIMIEMEKLEKDDLKNGTATLDSAGFSKAFMLEKIKHIDTSNGNALEKTMKLIQSLDICFKGEKKAAIKNKIYEQCRKMGMTVAEIQLQSNDKKLEHEPTIKPTEVQITGKPTKNVKNTLGSVKENLR